MPASRDFNPFAGARLVEEERCRGLKVLAINLENPLRGAGIVETNRSNRVVGGPGEDRTPDPLVANHSLAAIRDVIKWYEQSQIGANGFCVEGQQY